ncbi:MAG: ribonuclease P protein component [Candidatus Daviesbacteria bacterium]|nr:ribonuclease P protein component [Candidatus Daviesbacteria bacterium]
MLPKEKRLNLRQDFKWVASGERLENELYKIFLKFGQNKTPRIGISLSKGVFKKAVSRNRARRLTSVAVRALYPALPQSLNLIILPREGVLKQNTQKLTLSLKELLVRLKAVNEKSGDKIN